MGEKTVFRWKIRGPSPTEVHEAFSNFIFFLYPLSGLFSLFLFGSLQDLHFSESINFFLGLHDRSKTASIVVYGLVFWKNDLYFLSEQPNI